MTVLARLVGWLFAWRQWRPRPTSVSEAWLAQHKYEGIRDQRVREAER